MGINDAIYIKNQLPSLGASGIDYSYLTIQATRDIVKEGANVLKQGLNVAGSIVEEQNQIKIADNRAQLQEIEMKAKEQYLYGNGSYNDLKGVEAYRQCVLDMTQEMEAYFTSTKNSREMKEIGNNINLRVQSNINAFEHEKADNAAVLNFSRNQIQYQTLFNSYQNKLQKGDVAGAQLDRIELDKTIKGIQTYVNGRNSYGQVRYNDQIERESIMQKIYADNAQNYVNNIANENWQQSREGNKLELMKRDQNLTGKSSEEIAEAFNLRKLDGSLDIDSAKLLKQKFDNNTQEIITGSYDPTINTIREQTAKTNDSAIDINFINFKENIEGRALLKSDHSVGLEFMRNNWRSIREAYQEEMNLAGANPSRMQEVELRYKNKIREIMPQNWDWQGTDTFTAEETKEYLLSGGKYKSKKEFLFNYYYERLK